MTLQVSPQTKRVFHLSLPIFAELLLQLLVGNMDQFMISHFGSAAVAAIGNTLFPYTTLFRSRKSVV